MLDIILFIIKNLVKWKNIKLHLRKKLLYYIYNFLIICCMKVKTKAVQQSKLKHCNVNSNTSAKSPVQNHVLLTCESLQFCNFVNVFVESFSKLILFKGIKKNSHTSFWQIIPHFYSNSFAENVKVVDPKGYKSFNMLWKFEVNIEFFFIILRK